MAQQLTLPAIAGDPGSNPSIYARWLITTYDYSLWPPQEPNMVHKETHAGIHTYT